MLDRTTIDAVLRGLVSLDHGEKRTLVKTPLLYPGGGSVCVRVTNGDDTYTVSDMALGHDEAQSMGASTLYTRHVQPIAEDAGVALQQHQLVVERVDLGQLVGAVMAVANCSLAGVLVAADRQEERENRDDVALLVARLEKIFKDVRPRQPITGSSNYHWTVDAMVRHNDQIAVFDAVKPHHGSVFPTTTKFYDLASLEEAPICVAAVKSIREMGDLYNVLSQSGNVIEATTPDRNIAGIMRA